MDLYIVYLYISLAMTVGSPILGCSLLNLLDKLRTPYDPEKEKRLQKTDGWIPRCFVVRWDRATRCTTACPQLDLILYFSKTPNKNNCY